MCQNKRQVLLLREPAGNIFVKSQFDPNKFEHFCVFPLSLLG